jgi:hypothetical protein
MGLNNKKYLDYAGLEKLVDMHAVVPHPQVEITSEGAYKIAFDEHGHITSKSPLTAADLKLGNAMHFVGVSTTDPAASTGATVAGHTGSFVSGDVCIYKRSGETGYEEYIYTGTAWELLGDASSYALKEVTITGDGTYITGGGDLSTNRTFSHKTYTAADAAIKSIGRDTGGHVVIGKDILVQSGGGGNHNHTTSTTIAKDTYVTDVTDTHTKLSIKPTTAKVLKGIEEKFANLNTTSITGVSGSTTASRHKAGTAIEVAKAGTAVVYGKADVGTQVTGLAKRAASTTTVGNANIAASATIIGNADVGDAVTYGTANVGTAITVQDGKADVGSATRYGTANVGNAISVAQQATAQTKVGNADVGSAVTYGTADVGTAVVYGTADVGDSKTVATRATAQTTVGNANIASSATTVGNANVGTAVSVLNSFSNTARTSGSSEDTDLFHVAVDEEEETLILTPRIVTTGNTSITPASKSTTSIYGAVASETKIYGVGGTTTVTSAKAAPSTQTLTPAVASTKTLTPAKAVSDSSTKIYGVSGSVSITPAEEAPSTQTLTPAVASNRTKSIAPAVASTKTLTPAKAATATIYGAVESTTEIYGVTADQVSILPAKAAPSTQTIIPAVANGTITPYTFTDVTVPKAATAITVATGSVSVGGAGAAIMTGVDPTELDVMTAATIVKDTITGDVDVVDEVTATKNATVTFTGTTDSHTEGTHTHTLYTE